MKSKVVKVQNEDLFNKWLPLEDILEFVYENSMINGSNFILDNWDCKYVNIRVDMRTATARMTKGNTHVE